MFFYILLIALAAAYLVCYIVHCFRCRTLLPAVGAIVLLTLPVTLIVVFVSIMLQKL